LKNLQNTDVINTQNAASLGERGNIINLHL